MANTNALMSPIRIRGFEIRNRVLMPAMDTNYGDSNGFLTPRMQAHYVERAKGGVGLIVTEALSACAPEGRISSAQVLINDDRSVSRFLYLTDSVHAFGAKILAQLHHGGFKAIPEYNNGIEAVTASAEAGMGGRTLTVEEISKIRDGFIHSAKNAAKAGFDGVEIHAAHGYLINQFCSPSTNFRTDEYGGSLENRARFLREIIEGIRQALPGKFILGVRLSAWETVPDGLTEDEAVQLAKWCQEAGADIINLSAGHVAAPNHGTMSQWDDHQNRIELVRRFKAALDVPVSIVGKFRDAEECSRMIEDGDTDLVTIGRQMLADPHWCNKVMTGRLEEIRPCLNCNEGCISRLINIGGDVRCVMNPYVGYDDRFNEHDTVPAAAPKKVAVVGGGPAGMQFAITSSARGHDVTIFEKADRLGGQMHLAAMTPFKEDMQKAVKWFIAETERSGAEIVLNKEVTVSELVEGGYDRVIIACGSIPNRPPIPGIERAADFKSTLEAGMESLPENQSVTIIGGGTVGCEIAHLLVERGCEVTVLEMLPDFCNGMESTHKWLLMNHLQETATLASGVQTKEITEDSVVYVDADGNEKTAPAQTVIYSTGQRPAGSEMAMQLAEAGIPVNRLGESITTPGNIRTSTRSSLEVAYSF